MEKIVVYPAAENCGDGSVSIRWYLTQAEVYRLEESGKYLEINNSGVETYVGSNIHQLACQNSKITSTEAI